jgi:hypothetical protein
MATVVDEAVGVIRTKSALGAPGERAQQTSLPVNQVNMLWHHYRTARSTLERLQSEKEGEVDVHSSYADRAVRLLEVLVLRKEKVGGWVSREGCGWAF